MRLFEFQLPTMRFRDALMGLQSAFHLEQVGGPQRIYAVGDMLAVAFVVDSSEKGIALAWHKGVDALAALYVWNKFDILDTPDFVVDIPSDATATQALPELIKFIRAPKTGLIENVLTEARQCSPEEFKQLAVKTLGADGAAKASLIDMNKVASENDVKIPGAIRMDRTIKVDAHHWNLTNEDPAEVQQKLAKELGGDIEDHKKDVDPEYHQAIELSKVKTLSNLASSGKLYLMGRKAKGAFFRIPGVDNILAQLERMVSNQIAAGSGEQTMEEQYEQLIARVNLVAGGESAFIKSLLITGAPSSGKTFTVMKTIKELGLEEGKDYVVKKGRITTASLYRVLIEQVNGMVIFDDCDSVVEDKNAINMLKGALDTDPVREISYDVRGTINTAVMGAAERDAEVNAISAVLRGKPTIDDMVLLNKFLQRKKKKKDEDGEDDDFIEYDDEIESTSDINGEDVMELQHYFAQHMPNKIDFKGRIIFISNMSADEWDSAILTRAFHVDMNFSDSEMLDYIDNIKQHIKTPNLSEEEKQEVMDYLRELWSTGKLKRPINFRLVQASFDLRLTDQWKKLMSLM